MKKVRNAALTAVMVVAVVVTIAVRSQSEALPEFEASGPARPLPQEGTLPDVTAEEFEGILVGQVGKPVVVNVWASWCAPCRAEMPLLQRAADDYAGRAVVLGVASDDSRDDAQGFLDEFGLTYPNVLDTTGEIGVRLGLAGFPTTYFFDVDGNLTARVLGGVSEQQLASMIDDALR